MKKMFLVAAAVLMCISCGGQGTKKKVQAQEVAVATEQAKFDPYVMPPIPAMFSEPEQMADFASRHFWDNFSFADTLSVTPWSDYAEQAFVDYVNMLINIPREMGDESIGIFFRKTYSNKVVFDKFAEIAEKYLFDPNSPYRDDEYYLTVLHAELANPALDQWERIRPEEQLRLGLKNRVGAPAANFRYTLASGATGTLYGLRALYTLVFFNNPGCPACRETQEQIVNSPLLSGLVVDGSLVVLAVYPDEDLAAWREHAPQIPAAWINSYDKGMKIKTDELYDLKAIPTLYLLDRSKKVMLKDVTSVQKIEQTLYNDTNGQK